MQNPHMRLLSATCVLALSACAGTGKDAKPQTICPEPPRPPVALMTPPNYEQRVRVILFESEPSATPASVPGSGTPEQ